MEIKNYKIEIFLPGEYIEAMRNRLNEIGACRVGAYDNVVSYHQVKGYWRPLEESSPFNGVKGEVNHGEEYKMEIRCSAEIINEVMQTIRRVHPYEEPLINIIPLVDIY